ncbi:MAG: DUF928 domain-containing protein [Lyngbya sp.]|nr:DUF928 domain-containing protein [Lyngbya sp.]
MNYRPFQHRHLISAVLCVGMLIASSSSTLAESSPSEEIKALSQANNSKTSYTDRGQPKVQTGQASRGSCSSGINSEDLLAYIPSETAEEYPSFQFEIPFESTSFHSVEFVLMEDNDEAKMIYETQLASSQVSPEFQINLPQTSTELEVNKSYAWKLIVHCSDPANPDNMQDVLYVEGSIKRVQLTTSSER